MENRSKADSRGLEKPETSLARAGSVKAGGAAGEHLVRVCLMRNVEDDLIDRRVEDVVQRYRELDGRQVGATWPPSREQ